MISKKILLSIGVLLFTPIFIINSAFSQSSPKEQIDQSIIGEWSKAENGNRLVIKSNGEIEVFISGQASQYNGSGSFERCTDGGANMCLAGERFKCAYHYSVVQKKLSLQFRKGGPDVACRELSGAYEFIK
jgi:hypothetical protein